MIEAFWRGPQPTLEFDTSRRDWRVMTTSHYSLHFKDDNDFLLSKHQRLSEPAIALATYKRFRTKEYYINHCRV